MLDDLEMLQGVVLRKIVAGATSPLCLAPFRTSGRVNSFVVNDQIGVFVKCSTKRLSPWLFTFHADQIIELSTLQSNLSKTFVVLVCGADGLAAIETESVRQIITFETSEQAWIRVARRPRTMYAISGNGGELPHKISRGIQPVLAALSKRPAKQEKSIERASQDSF